MRKQPLLVFHPSTGERLNLLVDPTLPVTYRLHNSPEWRFNPWTGTERNAEDIKNDSHGLLIWEREWGPMPGMTVAPPDEPGRRVDVVVPLSAPDILNTAAGHMRDRVATYDQPGGERSMGRTVAAFNAITGRDLAESEGWLLLQILKDVRDRQRSAAHQDSLEDCVAYAALKAEARLQGK